MANKFLFNKIANICSTKTNAFNEAGGSAYRLTSHQTLAQLATTGTMYSTFYANGACQVEAILEAAKNIEPDFIAKTAIYAYEIGYMKDMPALLLALLSTLETNDFEKTFRRIIRNGKMLRNFVQIMRSGVTGRQSLGSRPKRLVRSWLENAKDEDLLNANIGNKPSLADIIKMVHPKAPTNTRNAFFAWTLGKPYDVLALPENIANFEQFKQFQNTKVPNVPFQMLVSLVKTPEQWAQIAYNSDWQMLRQNLNTFLRHGAFELNDFTDIIALRLSDREEIAKARLMPYQLMTTFLNIDHDIPYIVREALQDAMEIACENVATIEGNVVICPDVSGSMSSPVTGYRGGASSQVRCIDVAALIAAAFMRKNPMAKVLPFEYDVVPIKLNPRDNIMTNAKKLADIGGGGTNCAAPLAQLINEKAKVDTLIYISDNQSWLDHSNYAYEGTTTMKYWKKIKRTNPNAKLICIDIQPYTTAQTVSRQDILNIGGFSDTVFKVIHNFLNGNNNNDYTVDKINTIKL